MKTFPNMALRQNQLWFPVTSLKQYVHVEQHESKGGHEGKKTQQEESKTLLSLQRHLILSQYFTGIGAETWGFGRRCESDNTNLQTLGPLE